MCPLWGSPFLFRGRALCQDLAAFYKQSPRCSRRVYTVIVFHRGAPGPSPFPDGSPATLRRGGPNLPGVATGRPVGVARLGVRASPERSSKTALHSRIRATSLDLKLRSWRKIKSEVS